MDNQQQALAFSRLYALFSDIFANGITAPLIPVLTVLPGMPELDAAAVDDYAAQHYQLFGHGVYPYAAVFLGEDALLGGLVTESALQFYAEFGYSPALSENPDHIAIELGALAFLCGAEADAEADGEIYHVQRIRQLQRRFLDEHLLRWLPALTFAIQQQPSNVYWPYVTQILEIVLAHRQNLGEDLMMTTSPFYLPPPPKLAQEEKTSLRDIASYLLTPAYTGFFISHNDITRLGNAFRLPHGFGKRQQMLTNLLRAAADYDVFYDLITEIEQMCTEWLTCYASTDLLPKLIRNTWMERLNQTRDTLANIRKISANKNLSFDNPETLEQDQAQQQS